MTGGVTCGCLCHRTFELRETAWREAYAGEARALVQKHSGKVLSEQANAWYHGSVVCAADDVPPVYGRHGHYLGRRVVTPHR
jgi:hypothetical protein